MISTRLSVGVSATLLLSCEPMVALTGSPLAGPHPLAKIRWLRVEKGSQNIGRCKSGKPRALVSDSGLRTWERGAHPGDTAENSGSGDCIGLLGNDFGCGSRCPGRCRETVLLKGGFSLAGTDIGSDRWMVVVRSNEGEVDWVRYLSGQLRTILWCLSEGGGASGTPSAGSEQNA
ncbi:hypothetical protein V8E36_002718 [Tilletia maclaganii]